MTHEVRVAWDGAEPGELAMARDVVIAGATSARGPGAAVRPQRIVRLHDWAAPCVSFGRAQHPPRDALATLIRAGVAAVRRPTGGGWLLHLPGDLAVTVAAPASSREGSLRAAAGDVARAIASGLAELGVAAALTGGAAPGPASRADVCFARADPHEVEAHGVKLAGVALGRVRRAILVQSALPLVPAEGTLAALAGSWDAPRADAVRVLAGVGRGALAGVIARALAGGAGRPAGWAWTEERTAEAVGLAVAMRLHEHGREE